jgi:hypothetical protein
MSSRIHRRAASIGEELKREDGLKAACDALEALAENARGRTYKLRPSLGQLTAAGSESLDS